MGMMKMMMMSMMIKMTMLKFEFYRMWSQIYMCFFNLVFGVERGYSRCTST